MVLKDAIQGTIWGNENKQFISYMNQYDTQHGKIEAANAKRDEYYEKMKNKYKDVTVTVQFTGDAAILGPSTYKGFDEILNKSFNENGKKGSGDMFYHDDSEYNFLQKLFRTQTFVSWRSDDGSLKELRKDMEKYNALVDEAVETQKTLNSGAVKLHDSLAKVDAGSLGYYQQIGNMYDISSFQKTDKNGKTTTDEEAVTQFTEIMSKAVDKGKEYAVDSDIGLAMLEVINEQLKNPDALKEGVEEQLKAVKKEIEDEMTHTQTFTWSGILDSVNRYSEDLKTTNAALKELDESGAITNDTFADLAKTLDTLDLKDVFASFENGDDAIAYVNRLVQAIDDLDTAYDINTGYVKVNQDSLELLQDAQERAAKGKIKAMINELAASRAAAASNVALIDAQISAIDAMIGYVQASGENTIDTDKMMAEANEQYQADFAKQMQGVEGSYQKITGDSAKWAEATLNNIGEVADAWSQY